VQRHSPKDKPHHTTCSNQLSRTRASDTTKIPVAAYLPVCMLAKVSILAMWSGSVTLTWMHASTSLCSAVHNMITASKGSCLDLQQCLAARSSGCHTGCCHLPNVHCQITTKAAKWASGCCRHCQALPGAQSHCDNSQAHSECCRHCAAQSHCETNDPRHIPRSAEQQAHRSTAAAVHLRAPTADPCHHPHRGLVGNTCMRAPKQPLIV
jgi:hypothetical protein